MADFFDRKMEDFFSEINFSQFLDEIEKILQKKAIHDPDIRAFISRNGSKYKYLKKILSENTENLTNQEKKERYEIRLFIVSISRKILEIDIYHLLDILSSQGGSDTTFF